jgi:hypothetical protein
MSQHYFETTHNGQPVTVTLGWDRPIGHYFMVIRQHSPEPQGADQNAVDDGATDEDDDDGILYSNLNEWDAFWKSLDDYRSTLKAMGIVCPGEMFEQVELDECFGVGNRHVWYRADGSFLERHGEHSRSMSGPD